jgi:hypothetical protein
MPPIVVDDAGLFLEHEAMPRDRELMALTGLRSTHAGPAGAFAQEYTVMRNTLSDNKLYGHEKASQYHIYVLTVL